MIYQFLYIIESYIIEYLIIYSYIMQTINIKDIVDLFFLRAKTRKLFAHYVGQAAATGVAEGVVALERLLLLLLLLLVGTWIHWWLSRCGWTRVNYEFTIPEGAEFMMIIMQAYNSPQTSCSVQLRHRPKYHLQYTSINAGQGTCPFPPTSPAPAPPLWNKATTIQGYMVLSMFGAPN